MTKLAILSLTTAALVPASLAAQTVAPPQPWQDVPPVALDLPGPPPAQPAPPPGVTWQRPVARTPVVAPAPMRVRPAPVVAPAPLPVRPTPIPQARVAPSPTPLPPAQVVRAPAPAPAAVAVRTTPPPVAPSASRVQRGFVMPSYWMGPQFQVREWDAYGFAEPSPDQHWVRYYDDGLLVDRYGRVIDVRHDVDWDQSGEAWAYDPGGVPVYVGDGDFYPDADDYAYVEGYGEEAYAEGYERDDGYYEDDYDYAYGAPAHGTCQATDGPGYYPPPSCFQGGYAPYGYGYGYGYGWGGVTITETTVTTQGCCAQPQVVVEEYPVKRVRRHKRTHVPRGERG